MNEPVKVGQVRESEYGPGVVEPLESATGGFFSLHTSSCRMAFAECAIERMPLLCPAPEDRRNGDLYRQTEGVEMMYLDHRASEPWADRCLSRGWRIVARGPEKAKPAGGILLMGQTDPATNGPRGLAEPIFDADTTVRFDPAKSMRRGLYPDSFGELARASFAGIEFPVCNLDASAGVAFRNAVAAMEAEASKVILGQAALSTPKADPAPFLPGTWVCMANEAEQDDRERDAYLVHSVDCINGKWTVVAKYEAGEVARPISARYFVPAPSAVRGHAIRRWNRATIEAARETPPRAVTSFGQRKGEAWERYQRQLAGLLDRASGAEPWLIGSGHVAGLLREGM